jgi:hypothetical protein
MESTPLDSNQDLMRDLDSTFKNIIHLVNNANLRHPSLLRASDGYRKLRFDRTTLITQTDIPKKGSKELGICKKILAKVMGIIVDPLSRNIIYNALISVTSPTPHISEAESEKNDRGTRFK